MRVEDLPVAVVKIDRDRKLVSVNEHAAQLVGWSVAELTGKSVVEAFRPRRLTGEDLLTMWHPSARLASVSRMNEQEVLILRADGSEVELLVDGGYERDESGQLTGATLLLRPRHRGPRRPRSGVRIVSAVSHELRSPLTSVRGFTSLLLKRWDDIAEDERRQMLQQIDRDARRISRMIGELLDITRIESGRVQLNRVDLDIRDVARDVMSKVELSWPDLEARLSIPTDFPRVDADPDKVDQVLTNLIENACKYASPKGIEIKGSTVAGVPQIEVSDCGPGIPEADMPSLFKQFFHSKEGRPTGTGLGLWISRGLIEAHGGEMTASSRVNEGTTFRFTLPERPAQIGLPDRTRRAGGTPMTSLSHK